MHFHMHLRSQPVLDLIQNVLNYYSFPMSPKFIHADIVRTADKKSLLFLNPQKHLFSCNATNSNLRFSVIPIFLHLNLREFK